MTGNGRARPPRAHWLFLSAALAVIAVLLTANALVSGAAGEGQGDPAIANAVAPRVLASGGPVVNAGALTSAGLVPFRGRIALTFDDGPTPYTAQVLDILERLHVHATFFVLGSEAQRRPDLIRRMMRDGDEVGVHTFTHPHLGAVSAWRERLELQETEQVLAAITGRTTSLLRLPYSSTPDAMTAQDVRALQRAGNYWAVFTTRDTRDWARPGVPAIVKAATTTLTRRSGAVVMMHDGGGDRLQTVRALRILIPKLTAESYRFTTVTQAVGVGTPFHQASRWQQFRGWMTIWLLRAGAALSSLLTALLIAVTVMSVLRLLALVLFARRHARRFPVCDSAYRPPVSVIVPAFNEAVGIADAVRSLVASTYPNLEIIVVDDGSTDDTALVVRRLDLPQVTVITQTNAGKPAALNAGIAAATGDVLILVDGDTVFAPDAVTALVGRLSDTTVGAVSGNTKVGNRRGLIGRWQHIEYVIGFNLDRRMFDVLHCMPTIPGAVGAFRRAVLAEVGYVSGDTLAEDTPI